MGLSTEKTLAASDRLLAGVEQDFDFLSGEYAALFEASFATSFQRPLWLHAFYRVLARQAGVRPLVITVRHPGDGRLEAVLPLVLQRAAGVTIAQPADLGVSDYNAVVCSRETLATLLADRRLVGEIRSCWREADAIFFRKVRDFVDETAALIGAPMRAGNENDAHEVDLPGRDFDEWKTLVLRKNLRKNILRRYRKLKAEHRSVEFRYFRDSEEIGAALAFIRDHRTERFKDDILRDARYFDFYRTYAVEGAASGEALTTGIVVDGRLIAADFGIVGARCYHSILCAARIDEFREYAPGLQALVMLIQERHAAGDTHFDLGIGDAGYKSDFGATAVPLTNLTGAMTLKGRAVTAVYHHAKPMKTLLRELVGTVR